MTPAATTAVLGVRNPFSEFGIGRLRARWPLPKRDLAYRRTAQAFARVGPCGRGVARRLPCCQYSPGRRGLWEAARADALPPGRKCSDMEGILLCAGVIAVLVGLGALVEAARPRRSGCRGPVDRRKLSV